MARIPDEQLEDLKRNVSILHVCAARGIDLKRHGAQDYVGRCPFHEDTEPSLVVTPGKNLFHCMGCDAAGSVIDLVMKLDRLSFREAVDKLMTSTGLVTRAATSATAQGYGGLKKEKKSDAAPALSPDRAAQLLERVVTIYEKNLAECSEGLAYLKDRGIEDKEQLSAHRAGFSNSALHKILPKTGAVIDELKALGVLSKSGREHFAGCVVFPVLDVEGNIVTLYGRAIDTTPCDLQTPRSEFGAPSSKRRHVFLPRRPKGLWNAPIIKTYPEIILVESILDALSVEACGHPNVLAIHGSAAPSDTDIEVMKQHGVAKLTLLLDGDEAGAKAAQRLKEKFTQQQAGCSSFSCEVKRLPDGLDPNAYLQQHGAKDLARFLSSDAPPAEEDIGNNPVSAAAGPTELPSRAMRDQQAARSLPDGPGASNPPTGADGFSIACGLRAYQVIGLEKGPRKLRATLRVEHGGKLHVDTLDLYSSRSRKILAGDLCRLFEETPETIEADIAKLIKRCESVQLKAKNDAGPASSAAMTPAGKTEAEAFGQRADLVEAILADFEKSGLVGEAPNKLLCYLAAVSRKMADPLSVLLLSSSGAGKTALQDATLGFVPPEDLVKLTSLSGKALFYKERLSLKHKVLALEEGDGAEEATYAIRNLISAGELVIESTIKDLTTGRLTTMENRVEGPTSVFITTTNPDTHPETKTRFWVTSIDESRAQTRRILDFQRQRQTLGGVRGCHELDAILTRHHNFQRLLKPLSVVNPFADRLTYADDRLQGRRDHPKYLNLIKAAAFLRQMQRPIRQAQRTNGETFDYIEVRPEDVRLANGLAHEILGHSLDELSRPSRALLMELEKMVAKRLNASGPTPDADKPARLNRVAFTRREIREYTGWSNYRVHTHLKELIEFEYVSVETDRMTNSHRYRLLYDGQGKDGERFVLGLTDPDNLPE